jgi:hypothetical protein
MKASLATAPSSAPGLGCTELLVHHPTLANVLFVRAQQRIPTG